MILDQSLFFGMADMYDRHRDMRLDVDNMSYEVGLMQTNQLKPLFWTFFLLVCSCSKYVECRNCWHWKSVSEMSTQD